jgi:hypothetical protein
VQFRRPARHRFILRSSNASLVNEDFRRNIFGALGVKTLLFAELKSDRTTTMNRLGHPAGRKNCEKANFSYCGHDMRDCAIGHGTTGRTTPGIDAPVACGICRGNCCAPVFPAVVFGAFVPLGAIGLGIATSRFRGVGLALACMQTVVYNIAQPTAVRKLRGLP